jgi:hypothetical protein
MDMRPGCCQLATKTVITGTPGWTLTLPNAQPGNVAPITSTPNWTPAIPGSQYIGPAADAGSANYPGGKYVYSYHFCLCGVPKGINAVPAALSLKVFADDIVTVKLNNNTIAQSTGPAYNPPGVVVNLASTYFRACDDNYLTFEVTNWTGGSGSPTGLDVSGWISGYFNQPAPGTSCRCRTSPIGSGYTNPN